MARRRKFFRRKRRFGRKRFNRKRKGYTTRVALAPINPRCLVKMKYCETDSYAIGSGTNNVIVYRLNSIQDPNQSGVGHQPYGHDQYSGLYNRYRVYKASWRILLPASDDVIRLCVVPTNTYTPFAGGFDEYCESPRAIFKTVNFNGGPSTIVKGHISLARLNGATTTQYKADDRFQAQFGSSPTEAIGLHVALENPGGSTVTVRPIIQLKFHCELFDPIEFGQS